MIQTTPMISPEQVAGWVTDARQQTVALVADLTDEQLRGPCLEIVNPLIWEIGHVTWFQERWVLRRSPARPSIRGDADALYDSARVPHDDRWTLPLPSREATLRYMQEVRDRVLDRLQTGEVDQDEIYFNLLAIFHEDMHTEAFTYTRQTLGYPAPSVVRGASESAPGPPAARVPGERSDRGWPLPGDVPIPGGTFMLGAMPDPSAAQDPGFVFDNEKWAHPVEVRPFAIARAPVTNAEFEAFVEAGGYRRPELWSEAGWSWRQQAGAEHPVYWRHEGGWHRRVFDRLVPLEPHHPVLHVNWYEAEAYCRWAGRRLPTEAEWELAASAEPAADGRGIAPRKRLFPWGDEAPTPERANLDWQCGGCADVGAFPEGDSAFGCRQMIGNVWEWTNSPFLPYPGFVVDPYKEYSEPWFGTRKVLRGGCWTTRARLIRNTWRNFYTPDRRDVWAGFRTCAL